MPALESIKVPALVDVDEQHVKSAAAELHPPILEWLTVKNAELGKAYSVGVDLASTAIGVAINYVPALPADSEVEKLRDNNPGPNKGPFVEPMPFK